MMFTFHLPENSTTAYLCSAKKTAAYFCALMVINCLTVPTLTPEHTIFILVQKMPEKMLDFPLFAVFVLLPPGIIGKKLNLSSYKK